MSHDILSRFMFSAMLLLFLGVLFSVVRHDLRGPFGVIALGITLIIGGSIWELWR